MSNILDKLAKLLELAESDNEHEAELAAQRASELMTKHSLEVADVEAHKVGASKPKIDRGRIDAASDDEPFSRVENWHKSLAASIAEVLNARVIFRGRGKLFEFRLIGPADSVTTARYLYLHLVQQINAMSRAAQRRHNEPQNAWRRSYALGMVSKTWIRLKAGKAEAMKTATSTALVWVDKTKLAIEAEMASMKLRDARTGPKKRADAASWGYRDGDKVDLGSSTAPRLGEGQKKLT